MNDFYMTVRSVTLGQKGREALARAGIHCRLLRAPREIAPGGCAYALALRGREAHEAVQILDRARVSVVGCWVKRADGNFVRLEP